MKAFWQKFEAQIDGLSLRERAMAFAIAALVIVTLLSFVLIDPLMTREKQLSQRVKQDRQLISAMQSEILDRVRAYGADPDADDLKRLQDLKRESGQLRERLHGMQASLVEPIKMVALLEDLLKRDGKLQLRSLRTLPVTLLNEPETDQAATAQSRPAPDGDRPTPPAPEMKETVYKHSVEIVVEGSYLDLLRYLAELESLPWKVFWAQAQLNAEAYPKTTLSLTLFTLSLDRKWLNI